MKKLTLAILFFISIAATAQTANQKRANEITVILNSPAIQSLLQQEDGVGLIESISAVPSMTESSMYSLKFSAYSGPQTQICDVMVSISTPNKVAIGRQNCKESPTLPPEPNVCENPSPIGCLDHPDSNQPQ